MDTKSLRSGSLRRLGSCLHTRGGSFAPIVERKELPRRTRPSAWHVTTPCADGLGLGYLQPGKTIVYYRSDGGCQLSRPSPSDASRAVARAASIPDSLRPSQFWKPADVVTWPPQYSRNRRNWAFLVYYVSWLLGLWTIADSENSRHRRQTRSGPCPSRPRPIPC